MSRKSARECALKLVFEYVFTKERNKITFDEILSDKSLTKEDKLYIYKVYEGVTSKYMELEKIIERNAKGIKAARIYKTDLALLLLAVYEMYYIDEIPLAVSINEAVDNAKIYSTEKSTVFINGVLAGVYKELTKKQMSENPTVVENYEEDKNG